MTPLENFRAMVETMYGGLPIVVLTNERRENIAAIATFPESFIWGDLELQCYIRVQFSIPDRGEFDRAMLRGDNGRITILPPIGRIYNVEPGDVVKFTIPEMSLVRHMANHQAHKSKNYVASHLQKGISEDEPEPLPPPKRRMSL